MTELLCPKYLVPVRPRGEVLLDHAVAIYDGRICAVGPRTDMARRFPEASRIGLETHVLMPGLINMHTHSPMTLLRGFADDVRLDTWLKDHIWPAELEWADREFVRDGTNLAILEMIQGGTTCFNENYFFPDSIAESVSQAGMRACIGIPLIDFETKWARDFDQYLHRGLEVAEKFSANKRLSFAFAPHSMYSVSNNMLERIAVLSAEKEMCVHMHLLETDWEIEYSSNNHGLHPLQQADQLGLLNDRLLAVHMTHLSDADIALLNERRVNVVHCPQSNLKLASGICRLQDLLNAGVNVCVGTDGAASNNDLDLLNELQTAALLAKGASNNPCAVNAVTALDLITINAARALGQENELGSIETGKHADLVALDLNHARTQPLHNVISQIVYAAEGSQVSDVWIAGRRVLEKGQLTSLDKEAILKKAANWGQKLQTSGKRVEAGAI